MWEGGEPCYYVLLKTDFQEQRDTFKMGFLNSDCRKMGQMSKFNMWEGE